MKGTEEIIKVLSENIKNEFTKINYSEGLEEIRIKVNKPLVFLKSNKEIISTYIATLEDIKIIVQRISNYSIYAFEEEIKQGYITIRGGHRIGLCGRCVMEDSKVKTIKNISSINFRVSREVIGCSDRFIPYILNEGKISNTIIISPPQCGKTTILRDLARNISGGIREFKLNGRKVCIVDERSEIAACESGVPQMDVGLRTDVLDACLKSEGIMMAIRSMSPEVVICDEIGTEKDMASIITALNCGISLIATIHGNGIDEFFERQVFDEILKIKVFKRALVLSNKNGAGTLESVYDFEKDDYIWMRSI